MPAPLLSRRRFLGGALVAPVAGRHAIARAQLPPPGVQTVTMLPSSTAGKVRNRAEGVVDASGNCSITFDPCPQGSIITEGVTVYDSPAGITWTLNINGMAFDTTVGSATVGNVQLQGNEVLSLTAVGLLTGHAYHASTDGVIDQASKVPLVPVSPDSVVAISGGAGPQPISNSQVFTIQSSTFTTFTPIVNVAGYPMVVLDIISAGSVPTQWFVASYLQPFTFPVGVDLVIDKGAPGFTSLSQVYYAPQAPFLAVGAIASSAPLLGNILVATGYPTPVPRSAVMPPTRVISQQSAAIGANATVSCYPGLPTFSGEAFLAGEYTLWGLGFGASGTSFRVMVYNYANAAWEIAVQQQTSTAADVFYTFTAPVHDWRIDVINKTASATTFDLLVVGPSGQG